MINNHKFQEHFYSKLPNRPYCSWGKGEITFIRPKRSAIKLPIIQINPPHQINYLVFDIDAPDSYHRYVDCNLPTPTWIAKNPKNGHSHVCYELKNGVCKTNNARIKPLKYLASIQYTYAKILGADLGYVGLLTKNPLAQEWQVFFLNPNPFELGELADYIDLERVPTKPTEVSGLGRNCMLFDLVRFWAYKAIREHLQNRVDFWYDRVLEQAISVNETFLAPLQYSEVKSVAKSIARWVWRNHLGAHEKFIKRQSYKGQKGSVIANSKGACSDGGKARSAKYADMRNEALKLHLKGINNTKIAEQLKVSRRTVIRWINTVKVKN